MSWLARSLVNTFRGDDDQGSEQNPSIKPGNVDRSGVQNHTDGELASPSRGVKEDISELTKTITRQFWGVASFLAPPPEIPQPDRPDSSDSVIVDRSEDSEVPKSPRMAGIRSDLAELGGRFKSGISILSNTKAVSEISKIASTFLPFGDVDEEDEDRGLPGAAMGITEEVLLFVSNISMHPETWLDFPLIAEDEDPDDFEMSDVQQEHALAVERLEPRLAALRIEICPSHMSEGCFWKIYFVLLHSRLNKHEADLLSTPQIIQARAMLLSDLQSRAQPKTEKPASSFPSDNVGHQHEPTLAVIETVEKTEKLPVDVTEVKIIDKIADEKVPQLQPNSNDLQADAFSASKRKEEGDDDDWLQDEAGESSNSRENAVPLGNDEEVSFSDLEEEDDHPARTKIKTNSSHDEWLDVDEIDVE